MTKIWTGLKSQVRYLRRVSIVYAVELRLTIVAELYMREMSPKQFYEEFGGGSISRVDRHFKVLAKHGWLTFIRSETGGRRHGATENFYRATQLAVLDIDSWSLLPFSIRMAFSGTSFKQLAERIREALWAQTFDARPERHFTWTLVHVDRRGWTRLVTATDALFEALFERQDDAGLRLADSGERPIMTTVGLAAFESPRRTLRPGDLGVGPELAEGEETSIPHLLRLAKVFADEICLRIVAELNLRAMSVPQFHREFADDLGHVSLDSIRARFKKLVELGWLKRVDVKRGNGRRGAPEHLYRATGPAIFDLESWKDVPSSIKATYSWRTFEQLVKQVKQAMEAGTFDARTERHLTWTPLRLDQQGWEEVIAEVDALFALIFEEQNAAKVRLAKSGEEPIPMTVVLSTFESPQDAEKQP